MIGRALGFSHHGDPPKPVLPRLNTLVVAGDLPTRREPKRIARNAHRRGGPRGRCDEGGILGTDPVESTCWPAPSTWSVPSDRAGKGSEVDDGGPMEAVSAYGEPATSVGGTASMGDPDVPVSPAEGDPVLVESTAADWTPEPGGARVPLSV